VKPQRYPADYDAIRRGRLRRGFWTHHTAGQMWIWQATHKDAASYIPPEKYPCFIRLLSISAMRPMELKTA